MFQPAHRNGCGWYADSPGGGPDDWADMGRTGAAGIANFLSPYSAGDYRKQALPHSKVIGEHPQSLPDTHGSPAMGMASAALAANLEPATFRKLIIDFLPTHPVAPKRGVRLAVSLDGAAPLILSGMDGAVLANLRRLTTTVKIASPGQHSLTVWMVDPGIVIDKPVLDFSPPKDTYPGPPESYRR